MLLRCSLKKHSQSNNHKNNTISKNREVSSVTKHTCPNQAVFEAALMLSRTQMLTHHSSSSTILCQIISFQLRKYFKNKAHFNFNPLRFQNSTSKKPLRAATPETETPQLTTATTTITLIESSHLHSKYIRLIPQGCSLTRHLGRFQQK